MPYVLPKYTPNINPGDVRRRIWRNENENPLTGTPCAMMHEEEVILRLLDGGLVEQSFGNRPPPLIHVPTDPAEVVELRNIADDSLLGQTTLGMIHTMIYSLGRHMQTLRDIVETARAAESSGSYDIPKYTPNVNPGDTRRRIWRNGNENPLTGTPCAIMHEEEAVLTVVNGVNVERSFGNRSPPLIHIPVNPAEVVELRNIADDALLGTTTLGMIHTMIYSLGRHMQTLRDIAETARIAAEEAAAA